MTVKDSVDIFLQIAGALVIFLNYLGRLFRPIQALQRASEPLARPGMVASLRALARR